MSVANTVERKEVGIKPWSRVAILLFFLFGALVLSRTLTGSFFPSDPTQALILQGSLLLIVLG
jgi:hypothetical protein